MKLWTGYNSCEFVLWIILIYSQCVALITWPLSPLAGTKGASGAKSAKAGRLLTRGKTLAQGAARNATEYWVPLPKHQPRNLNHPTIIQESLQDNKGILLRQQQGNPRQALNRNSLDVIYIMIFIKHFWTMFNVSTVYQILWLWNVMNRQASNLPKGPTIMLPPGAIKPHSEYQAEQATCNKPSITISRHYLMSASLSELINLIT